MEFAKTVEFTQGAIFFFKLRQDFVNSRCRYQYHPPRPRETSLGSSWAILQPSVQWHCWLVMKAGFSLQSRFLQLETVTLRAVTSMIPSLGNFCLFSFLACRGRPASRLCAVFVCCHISPGGGEVLQQRN